MTEAVLTKIDLGTPNAGHPIINSPPGRWARSSGRPYNLLTLAHGAHMQRREFIKVIADR